MLKQVTEHRETFYLTVLPVYYKRIQLMNRQIEVIHRAGSGERARSLYINVYRKYIFGHSDDQNIFLIYIWSSFTVSGS